MKNWITKNSNQICFHLLSLFEMNVGSLKCKTINIAYSFFKVDELVVKTHSSFYDKCLTGMTAGGTAGSIAGLPGIGVGAVIGGSIGASKAVFDTYRK